MSCKSAIMLTEVPRCKLGPQSQDSVVPGILLLSVALGEPVANWVQHTDLILRYVTYCLCLRESVTGTICYSLWRSF
jgi:hypothetical protein